MRSWSRSSAGRGGWVGNGLGLAFRGTILAMTPTSPALQPPIPVEPTHPCARCGAPVGPGIGLCERCNPLGLRDVASGQVHGSVFIAVSLAIAILAIAARLAVAGIGPFPATIDRITSTDRGLAVTLTVTNDGAAGGTTCRISLPDDRGVGTSAFVTTPRLGSHETRTFTSVITEFGTAPREFVVACRTP
jgi:hypothetical protein